VPIGFAIVKRATALVTSVGARMVSLTLTRYREVHPGHAKRGRRIADPSRQC
jgi:hypothetical protein